jgi:hypothetical protein
VVIGEPLNKAQNVFTENIIRLILNKIASESATQKKIGLAGSCGKAVIF